MSKASNGKAYLITFLVVTAIWGLHKVVESPDKYINFREYTTEIDSKSKALCAEAKELRRSLTADGKKDLASAVDVESICEPGADFFWLAMAGFSIGSLLMMVVISLGRSATLRW